MKTPITDRYISENYNVRMFDAQHCFNFARRLETDRAVLIDALKKCIQIMPGSFNQKERIGMLPDLECTLAGVLANFPDESSTVCCGCENEPERELHSCPYLSDVNDDEETLCNCCEHCENECAQDI